MTKFFSGQSKSSAPEIRRDPLTGLEVLIAPDRMQRPGAIQPIMTVDDDPAKCPFCPGREAETPKPIREYRVGGSRASPAGNDSWQLRVIPNRYPALVHTIADASETLASANRIGVPRHALPDPYGQMSPARGFHEVVVETPRHSAALKEWQAWEFTMVFQAYRDRFRDWRKTDIIRHGIAFKNHGFEAGASLSHAHSQLIALDFVPGGIRRELDCGMAFRSATGGCLLCEIMRQESGSCRVILEQDEYLVWCPFAAGMPYEIWIAPQKHASHFDHAADQSIEHLGSVLWGVLQGLDRQIPGVAFNWVVQSAPFDIASPHDYHWHLRIIPRLVRKAGFEWYSGCQINPVAPEVAAQSLRS